MPGLSAPELPPEALRAGEAVEYFSRAFVWGDRRGYRRAVVTRVHGGANVEFPIAVGMEEVIPTDMMVKRVADRFAIPLKPGDAMWRKLRTFELMFGSFAAPTRSSRLNKALKAAVAAAYAAVREEHRVVPEEIVRETPQSSACSKLKRRAATQHPDATLYAGSGHAAPHIGTCASEGVSSACSATPASPNFGQVRPPSTPARRCTPTRSAAEASVQFKDSSTSEGARVSSSLRQIIDLVSPGEESGMISEAEAAAYVLAIPNRHARAKIRHRAKEKRAQWHVPRSRKRRHLA